MNNDEFAKALIQILVALPATLMAAAALIAQIRRDRNKPVVDRSEANKTDAEAEKIEAERRRIEAESSRDLAARQVEEMKSMRGDLDKLKKDFVFIINFARVVYDGSRANYEFIKARGLEKEAPHIPPDRFPSGRLGELSV